jgi:two-component system, NtrC family, sensor histidine kinase HydH
MSLFTPVSKHDIFSSRLPFKASRTALALILATLFLAILLVFSIFQNINSAQDRMESFLFQKGETIIMAVEAGMRTSMMHFTGEGDPLQTLITESSREKNIAFIRIIKRDGEILNQTDNAPEVGQLTDKEKERVMDSDKPIVHFEKATGIFILSKRFHPHVAGFGMRMKMGEQGRLRGESAQNFTDGIISIGLLTREFDYARRQDVHHAMFMGAILFLVGSAGLYFLFLYQGMRVAQSTLANMTLYTDNVIESIPVGIITLDVEERIVSYNRKMEEIFGRSLENTKGEKIQVAFPGCPIDCSDICKTVLEHSAECSAGDGRNVPVKIGGSSLINNTGEVIGTVLIIRDMSILRDMEQQLERSRRMAALGKMATGIAHEIRNPLGTLRGFAQYFGNQASAGDEGRSYADLMVSEVDRLNRNISGLLQFARPREPQFVQVFLDELITKIVALMEGDFADHALNFNWKCNTGITFDADPDLLLQVLMNLLKNSIHATPSGGEVVIKGSEDEDHVRITVADTGSGMTEQEKEKMFDPFFTTGKTGTGLGLAVSHQIVEQHRGFFEIESVPGERTVVTVVLPKKRGRA